MFLSTVVRWVTVVAGLALAAQKPIGGAGAETKGKGNPLTPEFKKYALEIMEKWHLPGLAVAVIDGKNTFFEVGSAASVYTPYLAGVILFGS